MNNDIRPTVKFRLLDERIDALTKRVEELEKAKGKPPPPNTETVLAISTQTKSKAP